MLLMQNSSRPAGKAFTAGPACPNCGRSMHLAPVALRAEGLTDPRVYRCGECGVWQTEGADRSAA